MKANIYYEGKLYMETTLDEIESRHPNMKTGDRFNINDNEVIVVEMKQYFDQQKVDIVVKDFTGNVKDF